MIGTKRTQRAADSAFRVLLDGIGQLKPQLFAQDIDQSAFPGKPPTLVKSFLATLRSLKLIDGNKSTVQLQTLVNAQPDERRTIVRTLLSEAYPKLFGREGAKITLAILEAEIARIEPFSGATRRAVARILLSAAAFARIPLSPALETHATHAASTNGGKSRSRQLATSTDDATVRSTTYSVELPSGVVLTLSLRGNLLRAPASERRVLDGILDLMQASTASPSQEGVN